jgi:tripeptidyl-peptidase-1
MRAFRALAAFVALLEISFATPTTKTTSTYHIHEKRANVESWQKQFRADGRTTLPLRIGLRQSNLKNADKYLWDVSSPKSPNFGTSNRDKVYV